MIANKRTFLSRPVIAGLFAAAWIVAAAAHPAGAAPGAEPVVLETRVGERPADADVLLGPVLAELARSGFATPPSVATRIDGALSRSGPNLGEEQVAAAVRTIDTGYKMFLSGKFDAAIPELERGLEVLRGAPAAVAGKSERRESVLRALIGLALSHKRRGRATQATDVMKELVRTFPVVEVSYKDYGPETREFFDAVRQDLGRDGKGSIAIDVDDDRTVVFVNERYAGVGDVKLVDQFPGTYRVFLQQGERFGRVHEIKVEPGATTTVNLSWQLDAALRTAGAAALQFDDEPARRNLEARFAVRVARALGAPSVVLIGIRENRGRRSVVGAFFSADSTRPLRSGAVAVEPVPPGEDRFEALARLLAGDDAAAALVVPLVDEGTDIGAGPAPVASGADDRAPTGSSRPVRTWKWLALGSGLAAVAGGVTLVALHEPARSLDEGDSRNDQPRRNTRTAGIVTASVGAALSGVGVYLFIRDHRDKRAAPEAAAIVPVDGGAALVVSGRF
jgi:hypothetical protein